MTLNYCIQQGDILNNFRKYGSGTGRNLEQEVHLEKLSGLP